MHPSGEWIIVVNALPGGLFITDFIGHIDSLHLLDHGFLS